MAGYSEKDRQIYQSYGADNLVGSGEVDQQPIEYRVGQLLTNAIE